MLHCTVFLHGWNICCFHLKKIWFVPYLSPSWNFEIKITFYWEFWDFPPKTLNLIGYLLWLQLSLLNIWGKIISEKWRNYKQNGDLCNCFKDWNFILEALRQIWLEPKRTWHSDQNPPKTKKFFFGGTPSTNPN